ncbi:MAG: ribbon-helix-helix domain-containing protein [Promethearchaeota archaeon]
MRNITINLPNLYLEVLDKLRQEQGTSRSELIRRALKELLDVDLEFNNRIYQLFPKLDVERKIREELRKKLELKHLLQLKRLRTTQFYNFCIVCDNRVHTSRNPGKVKGVNVMELRFCCSCFKKFEGKTFDELPDYVIKKIKRKLKNYEKLRKNG